MLNHPILAPLSPAQRQRLFSRARLVKFAKGEVLLTSGERAQDLMLVASGLVRLEIVVDEQRTAVAGYMHRYDMVGHMALDADSYLATYTAQAVLPVEAFAWTVAEFGELVLSNPRAVREALRCAQADLSRKRLRVARMVAGVDERVIRQEIFLLTTGRDEEGRPVLDKRITQQEVAKALGIPRERVNKAIRALEREGLLVRTESGWAVAKGDRNSLEELLVFFQWQHTAAPT